MGLSTREVEHTTQLLQTKDCNMYLANTNHKKLTILCTVIFLATVSLIAGKTLANTIIITAYPTWILPYFYFSLALLMIITTLISSKYLQKSEKLFAISFKCIILCSLLIFVLVLKTDWHWAPFVVSIILLSYTSVITLIAWNYASDIFDIQEFKRFSKFLQVSSTVGAISAGVFVGYLAQPFSADKLLGLMFFIELLSLFFISPLASYVISPTTPATRKRHVTFSLTIRKNSVFKYLALMTLASTLIATLIDYNLKLELVATIEKQKIAHFISIIFVISTSSILIVQFFFIDYFFRVLGSKKIIIIYPIAILITSAVTLIHYNLYSIAILFIVNDVFNYTTGSLSRNLYLNILPRAIRLLDRLKLNGTITPLAIICSSLIVLSITYAQHKTILSLLAVIIICFFALYLARILINLYRVQLAQSVYLRRFNRDLINMSLKDNKEIENLLNQTINYPAAEAQLFGLQLLAHYKSLQLPDSVDNLLLGEHPQVIREAARVLVDRRKNPQFIPSAKIAFLKSTDEEARWYLALYLLEHDEGHTLCSFIQLLKNKTVDREAILCLIQLKQGDLEQQISAMQTLLRMLHSRDAEQKKWFLFVLNEIPVLQKERYLIEFMNQNNPVLKKLALRQIGMSASNNLLECLTCHLGETDISYSLQTSLIGVGDPVIVLVENRFKRAQTYAVKLSCFRIISGLSSYHADLSLLNLISNTRDVVMKTLMAKYIAYRGVKNRISEVLQDFLIHNIKVEVEFYTQLSAQVVHYSQPLIQEEIKSRLQFIKKRVLYYAAAIIGSTDILNSIPVLTFYTPDKNEQATALELIDSTIENRTIAAFLMTLFVEKKIKEVTTDLMDTDPWLKKYIQDIESNKMDSIYLLTRLRTIDLFKNLAAETLQVLANCCISQDMASGEVIFREGDEGDGIYIIDSGEVSVSRQGILINTLSEGAYFGELALLAEIPRFATITALSEGVLFFLNKQDFDKITDEIPEIMKSINKQVIKYLITNVDLMSVKQ